MLKGATVHRISRTPAARTMATHRPGEIINISSMSGIFETDMTKAIPEKAREALMAQIPLARAGIPGDAASLAASLASDAAACITGRLIPVDGGLSM